MRSDSGTILYLVHQIDDVTDLVRAQARSTRLNAAVEQADRELESLSYAVSHDLRASLRAIDGFSRILEEDYAERLDSEGRRVLSIIRDSGARMGRQMEDVLAYSRLGRKPMSVATVNMAHIAREAFDEACDGARTAPMLEMKPLPRTRGDPALLKQVWLNLLANSVKFTAPRQHPLIDVSARQHETETIYSVRDNGVGFDMRNYGKLFGVFQRLHPEDEFPGSGVGLAIVQRLVARHGGRVWGESGPGEGATFHFSLPREETRA